MSGQRALMEGFKEDTAVVSSGMSSMLSNLKSWIGEAALADMNLPAEVTAAADLTDAECSPPKRTTKGAYTPEEKAALDKSVENKRLRGLYRKAVNDASTVASRTINAAAKKADALIRSNETVYGHYIMRDPFADPDDKNVEPGGLSAAAANSHYRVARSTIVDILGVCELGRPGILDTQYVNNYISYLYRTSESLEDVCRSIMHIAAEGSYDSVAMADCLNNIAIDHRVDDLPTGIEANGNISYPSDTNNRPRGYGSFNVPGIGEIAVTGQFTDGGYIDYIASHNGQGIMHIFANADTHNATRMYPMINMEHSQLYRAVASGFLNYLYSHRLIYRLSEPSSLYRDSQIDVVRDDLGSFSFLDQDSILQYGSGESVHLSAAAGPGNELMVASILRYAMTECDIVSESELANIILRYYRAPEEAIHEIAAICEQANTNIELTIPTEIMDDEAPYILFDPISDVIRIFNKNPYSKEDWLDILHWRDIAASHPADRPRDGYDPYDDLVRLCRDSRLGRYVDDDLVLAARSRSRKGNDTFDHSIIGLWSRGLIRLGDKYFTTILDYSNVIIPDTLNSMIRYAGYMAGAPRKIRFFVTRYCNSRFCDIVMASASTEERSEAARLIRDLYETCATASTTATPSTPDSPDVPAGQDAQPASRTPTIDTVNPKLGNQLSRQEHSAGMDTVRGVLDALSRDDDTVDEHDSDVAQSKFNDIEPDILYDALYHFYAGTPLQPDAFDNVISNVKSMPESVITPNTLASIMEEAFSSSNTAAAVVRSFDRIVADFANSTDSNTDEALSILLNDDEFLQVLRTKTIGMYPENDCMSDSSICHIKTMMHIICNGCRDRIQQLPKLRKMICSIDPNTAMGAAMLAVAVVVDPSLELVQNDTLAELTELFVERNDFTDPKQCAPAYNFVNRLFGQYTVMVNDAIDQPTRYKWLSGLNHALGALMSGCTKYPNLPAAAAALRTMRDPKFQALVAEQPIGKFVYTPIGTYVMLAHHFPSLHIELDPTIFRSKALAIISKIREDFPDNDTANGIIEYLGLSAMAGTSKSNVMDLKSNSRIKTVQVGDMVWSDDYFGGNITTGTLSPVDPNIRLFTADELQDIIPAGWHIPTFDELESIQSIIGTTMNFGNTGCIAPDGTESNMSDACFWRMPKTEYDESGLQIHVVHGTQSRPYEFDDPEGYRAAIRLVHD